MSNKFVATRMLANLGIFISFHNWTTIQFHSIPNHRLGCSVREEVVVVDEWDVGGGDDLAGEPPAMQLVDGRDGDGIVGALDTPALLERVVLLLGRDGLAQSTPRSLTSCTATTPCP